MDRAAGVRPARSREGRRARRLRRCASWPQGVQDGASLRGLECHRRGTVPRAGCARRRSALPRHARGEPRRNRARGTLRHAATSRVRVSSGIGCTHEGGLDFLAVRPSHGIKQIRRYDGF
jgi:hypothetical protein